MEHLIELNETLRDVVASELTETDIDTTVIDSLIEVTEEIDTDSLDATVS